MRELEITGWEPCGNHLHTYNISKSTMTFDPHNLLMTASPHADDGNEALLEDE